MQNEQDSIRIYCTRKSRTQIEREYVEITHEEARRSPSFMRGLEQGIKPERPVVFMKEDAAYRIGFWTGRSILRGDQTHCGNSAEFVRATLGHGVIAEAVPVIEESVVFAHA